MPNQTARCFLLSALVAVSTYGSLVGTPSSVLAQIVPDTTLGRERSILRSNIPSDRGLIDRIDGGALRGGNLFHSFSDFNVSTGQRVYFANPASISNIISRIMGRNLSNIDGTLGVLGGANLFLINPNGIVFGPNAQLDIKGSFVASTANQVLFPNGYAFDATNPDAPPLLTMNAPLGLASWLPTSGTVTSAGNLSTGQDLTLAGRTLNLQGQLHGGQNVNLIATNTLTARDSATAPFIASAAKQLLVQGNQSIDLSALNRAESGLFSGGDMVLRSNGSIVGDARFTAGGNFRAERLDGSLGSVISIQDPVFETGGDFAIADYTGASLQILAGGSVSIPGAITITGAGGPFNDSTIALSNGTIQTIVGTNQPTVDIRAGTTQFFGAPPAGTPTSANITIGSIVNPGGLVLLTNQYQPNAALSGDISVGPISTASGALGINGGSVTIDSRGKLSLNSIDASSGSYTSFFDVSTADPNSNGGDITLLAKGDLSLPFPSFLASAGAVGGNITLNSATAIVQANAPFGTSAFELSWIDSSTLGPGQGGIVRLEAPSLSIGGNVITTTYGDGKGGALALNAQSLVANQSSIGTFTFGSGSSGDITVDARAIALGTFSTLGSGNFSSSGGSGGNVTIRTGTLSSTDGSQVSASTFGVGNGGNITITAQEISLSGFAPGELAGNTFNPSGIATTTQQGAEGNGGTITITTSKLVLTGAAAVFTSSYGTGNAGNITVNATDSIRVDGAALVDFAVPPLLPVQPSAIQSELYTGAIGNGGNITINTPILNVTNGGTLTASTFGQGDAGSINITATKAAVFDGVAVFPGQNDRISRAAVLTAENATGNGGALTITTPSLTLKKGAQLTAETDGTGAAGNIRLNVQNTLLIDGSDTGVIASTAAGSTGNGGSIFVDPELVKIRNGARIAVDSQGTGTAGNIFLQAGSLVLDNRGLISAETVSNTGGNITLQVRDVIAMRRNSRISTSAGTAGAGGDGGNITINTQFLVASPTENSDITANAFTGRGGRVDITAKGIFGFLVLSRSELEAALGTSDPSLLNPAFLPTSDITAISQVNPNLNGEVIIQSPDPDPSRGALPLPPDVVDASRLIAQDCSAGSTIARTLGSLTVTGQGGLPPSPTDQLRGDSLLIGWDTPGKPASKAQAPVEVQQARSPVQLVEVQTLEKRPDGRVVLVAHAPAASNQEFWNRPVSCQNHGF
ncbi:MAG: filamentous hemagglutinin N-terminal domain-containing protein [Leptolyngbya sp. BL-A-14]